MKNNKFIIFTYWTIGISFILTLLIYFINFYGHTFSNKSADWGVFGDYFGGILNPITSVLNILIFIYLTRVISENEKKAHKRNLDQQKKLTIAQLRHSSYEELTKNLDSLTGKILNAKEDQAHYETTLFNVYINGFFENMSHLFPSLQNQETKEPITKAISEITTKFEQIYSTKNIDTQKKLITELKQLVKTYFATKQTLVKKLQEDMLAD